MREQKQGGGAGAMPTRDKSRYAARVEEARAASFDDRRVDILKAAEEAFTRQGFGATTMADIATAVGMSKKTLYKLFNGKAELFREVIRASRPEKDVIVDLDLTQPAPELLRSWVTGFSDFVFSEREIAIQRLVIGEARAAPDLPRIFTEMVASPGPVGLVEIVQRLPLKAYFRERSPGEVADLFIGVVFGTVHIRMLLSGADRPSTRQVEERISLALNILCDTPDHF